MFKVDPTQQYGILLSGGLDSAVLLGLLVKQEPKIKIQPFTIDKTDGAALYANLIIAHINTMFNSQVPDTIYVGDPTVHHSVQSITAINDIFKKHPVDILFNALNKNPPELDQLPNAPRRATKSTNPKIILPFVDMYKTSILTLMYENNLESLIDITHSCTERQTIRCNECWQCGERAWAFKQLDKIDTGTL